jgi:hypothetical protein
MTQLLTMALETKRNTIYEAILRAPMPAQNIIKDFNAAGFFVELHVLAVNSKYSVQGLYTRYEADTQTNSAARWTPILEFHDHAYRNFPESLDQIEAHCPIGRSVAYCRGQLAIHDSAKVATSYSGVKARVLRERRRPFTPEEYLALMNSWKQLVQVINKEPLNRPDWYRKNAERLYLEAALLCVSGEPRENEVIDTSAIEALTHHHAFSRTSTRGGLTCFERPAESTALAAQLDFSLMPQPGVFLPLNQQRS